MEERDVKQEPEQTSADSQEGVDEEATQPQETQETPQEAQPSGEGQPVDDFDEKGVPWKNRAMEFKRKYEDLENKFDQVTQKIDGLQTGSQQPQYTPEQLEMYSQQAENPAHAQWATQEAQRLRQQQQEQKVAKTVEQKLNEFQQKQKAETTKQQAFQQVVQRHPELVQKDQTGNVVGWNQKSPLYQRINQYMRAPELQNNPRGLRVATALAHEDLAFQKGAKTEAQVNKQKQEIRNLQKKTMVEGSGTKSNEPLSPNREAVERVRQTGSKKDATEAMKHILGMKK